VVEDFLLVIIIDKRVLLKNAADILLDIECWNGLHNFLQNLIISVSLQNALYAHHAPILQQRQHPLLTLLILLKQFLHPICKSTTNSLQMEHQFLLQHLFSLILLFLQQLIQLVSIQLRGSRISPHHVLTRYVLHYLLLLQLLQLLSMLQIYFVLLLLLITIINSTTIIFHIILPQVGAVEPIVAFSFSGAIMRI
jgi:hypothetical protein